MKPLFEQFCFDCHGHGEAAGAVDLAQLLADSQSFVHHFRQWRQVATMVAEKRMPPEDVPQLAESQRQQLASSILGAAQRAAAAHAGDPGPVLIRRLTSAEYSYTLRDQTGLDLDLHRDFVSDAVGGSGFTNAGVAQFIQDSTMERYLAAAKTVAQHAVVGAGPLSFYQHPGKSGFELSAIDRIQEIYRQFGFRTAAGEGGEPFGLDRLPRALFAAWKFEHRQDAALPAETLAAIAREEALEPRFVEHIWNVLGTGSRSFPTSEIVSRWRQLPAPDGRGPAQEAEVRAACEEVNRLVDQWQRRLAETAAHREQAAILTENSIQGAPARELEAELEWPEERGRAVHMTFSVESANPEQPERPLVIWHNPRIRFQNLDRSWQAEQPLRGVLAEQYVRSLAFGHHPKGDGIAPNDFVLGGDQSRSLQLAIPAAARQAELFVEPQLDLPRGENCVARCTISYDYGLPVRPAETVSALLADPESTVYKTWKAGVDEFARCFPQVSHREPAPSDRDPIPAPFDNTYNMPERNDFHTRIKYHRDDRFLVENMLDDATRERLDAAWADLLASFDYHERILRFVAGKYQLELADRTVGSLDDHWIDSLEAEPRGYVTRLRDDYLSIQRALRLAEPGHVADAVRFASLAWRRPLENAEEERLRDFYETLRSDRQLDHPSALRALLTRILVAPDFLYRSERPPPGTGVRALSDWERATRLSYFLWSSPPDSELRRAAAAGQLQEPRHLAEQARRMLRDPKARRFAHEFFGQWFGFYRFDRYRGVDPDRFPEFTDRLRAALQEEAVSFFEHIVRDDRPVSEILFADYTFLNAELARHYGLELTMLASQHARVANVAPHQRGGLLGLGAILSVTSAPLRTSPVKRGDWILRRILGTPVPPPPPDAGSIPADDVLADGQTVRARLEAHRNDSACMNCHSRIDPLGFALEHYDPLGRWRERYRDGQSIDASGILADGTPITGLVGLRRYLHDREKDFLRTLATKLVAYALGRSELIYDAALINELQAALRDAPHWSTAVVKIVTSTQFGYYRERAAPASQANVR